MGDATRPDPSPASPPAGSASCGCAPRVEALERSVEELRRRVDEAQLADLRRSVTRLRELLLDVAERIDESLTSA